MRTYKHILKTFCDMTITPNLGIKDRLLRVVIAMVVIGQLFVSPDAYNWQLIMSFVAMPLLATAVLGWDPLYYLFGIKVAKKAKITPVTRPSGILVSETYAERLRKQRYPNRYSVSDSTA